MNFSSVSPAIFWSIKETRLLTQGVAAAEQGEGFQGNQLGRSCLKKANLSSSSGPIDIMRVSVLSLIDISELSLAIILASLVPSRGYCSRCRTL